MNENQKKWLLDLQDKGVKFENVSVNGKIWYKGPWEFKNDQKDYRLPAQSIPDIPDWRELCREMHDRGIKFEHHAWAGIWGASVGLFDSGRENYRIPQQSLPEWREEMTKETEPGPREEIHHHELQVQWHEDKLHSLRTREPMREWEYRLKNGDGEWKVCHDPHFSEKYEYRRKPRTVAYWHCVARGVIDEDEGRSNVVLWSTTSMDDMEREINIMKQTDSAANFGPIIEATLEIAD